MRRSQPDHREEIVADTLPALGKVQHVHLDDVALQDEAKRRRVEPGGVQQNTVRVSVASATYREVLEVGEELVQMPGLHDFPLSPAAPVEGSLMILHLDDETPLTVRQGDVRLHPGKPREVGG